MQASFTQAHCTDVDWYLTTNKRLFEKLFLRYTFFCGRVELFVRINMLWETGFIEESDTVSIIYQNINFNNIIWTACNVIY